MCGPDSDRHSPIDGLGNGLSISLDDESWLAVCFIDYVVDVWVPGSRKGCLICLHRGVLLLHGTAMSVSPRILYCFDLVMCNYFTFRGVEGHLPDLFPVDQSVDVML